MDMMKMGPMARKPTNEKETKKEIESLFKKPEDVSARASRPRRCRHTRAPEMT